MNARRDNRLARPADPIRAVAVDGRVARSIVAAVVIGAYMGLGFAFGLDADAYLLLGLPITIAFQVLIVRRPLRELWLRDPRPMTVTPRTVLAIVVVAIAPAVVAVGGLRSGDAVLIAYGLVGMAGAVGAVHAIGVMDRDAIRITVRATLMTSAILVLVMVVYRVTTGGFDGNLGGAVTAAVVSAATYLPVVFVLEEVFFRGLLDSYLHGSTPRDDRATALYGSALWGLWHLPVMTVALGIWTIPYLMAIHTALGYVLVVSWRRTGNLAAPGIAHAVSDALRNAIAVV